MASLHPLHKDTFHILVSLANRLLGDAGCLRTHRRSGPAHPSTLYAAIKRLLDQGLIEELSERPDPDHDDQRRGYYRLTKLGRQGATAEARRLEQLLNNVRASGLPTRSGYGLPWGRSRATCWTGRQPGLGGALTGLATGFGTALTLGRFIRTLLFGVGTSDPATTVGVTGALLVVALLATLIPARRAARLDRVRALRQE